MDPFNDSPTGLREKDFFAMIPLGWAIALALAASFGGAWFGWDYRDGKVAQEVAKAEKQAILDHNEDAASDMMLTYEQGKREAAARTAGEQLRGDANAANKAKPFSVACRMDTERARVFDDAVVLANTGSAPDRGLHATVREANQPVK